MNNRDRPNILFIISDPHRFDASGCSGGQLVALAHTPNIDSLARDGVRFRHAYCQHPLCGPSRASIMTGTYSHTCNVYTHGAESVVPPNIGRILDCLDRQGLRDDTLVVYTSDHGDNLFEHGLVQKHGFFEGAVRQRIANLVDILPTLLELADIATPDSLEGQSLVPTMAGADALQGTAISDFYEFGVPERMIRTPEWKYVYSHGDGDQLYDMVNDPAETRNLAAQESAAAVRNTLRDQLLKSWDGVPDTWQPRSS